MEVVRAPKDGYWSEVWNNDAAPFCSCYREPRPIKDMIVSICYILGMLWNDANVSVARVDELVTAARGELDRAKRNEMYGEVQLLLAKEGGTIIPAFGQDISATHESIGILENIGGGREMNGGHFIKRGWKKA